MRSNKVSIIKMAESLYLPSDEYPMQLSGMQWTKHPLTVAACFTAEPGEDVQEKRFDLSIHTPSHDVPPLTFDADFKGLKRSRCYIDIPGLPDHGSGDYTVRIKYPTLNGYNTVDWVIDVRCDRIPQEELTEATEEDTEQLALPEPN